MADWEDDPDAPPTPEEVAASQRLRDSLEKGDVPELVDSLRAAWSPAEIDAQEHRALVDDAPSSADEIAASEALRVALDVPSTITGASSTEAVLAVALKNAFAPGELDADTHRAIVDEALARMPAAAKRGEVVELASRRRGNVVRVTFGVVTGALALAASIVLVLTWQGSHGSSGVSGSVALAKVRTTQPLFSEPFKTGETSARIDRIASARASDLRDNRFAKWGVR